MKSATLALVFTSCIFAQSVTKEKKYVLGLGDPGSWYASWASCVTKHDGYIAKVSGEQDQRKLEELLKTTNATSSPGGFWLAGTYKKVTGKPEYQLVWRVPNPENYQPINYTNWVSPLPDYPPEEERFMCAFTNPQGLWNLTSCLDKMNYFCEY